MWSGSSARGPTAEGTTFRSTSPRHDLGWLDLGAEITSIEVDALPDRTNRRHRHTSIIYGVQHSRNASPHKEVELQQVLNTSSDASAMSGDEDDNSLHLRETTPGKNYTNISASDHAILHAGDNISNSKGNP